MRRIRKSVEPGPLRSWREALRPRGSIPPWDDFPDPPRLTVRTRLAADQGQICCYCAGTVARGNFHIEHFRPRETYPRQTYRWANLLASCQASGRPPRATDVIETQQHCGAAKDNWFEDGVTVSPLEANVEGLFRYTLAGKVFPSKSLRGRYDSVDQTINRLNLNAPLLVARRAAMLQKANADASTLSRAAWTAHYLDPKAGGQLHEFWPALRYNYDKFWSERLA
ncbi:retron system putative HNH endonuclease [Sphingomonas sp. NIBR02145]|uniref:retron system putative HNH endonuclease n=1 Tax=Sphingomonas sp. NIBR02145 TaxID=3014784 RepID=UPI0022B31604|nr:retron system putative HNH endonuclease [Sphingomonas sp. NIBR02145]WHU03675.1 TIGR02646 family protein [Sphingomonas sp. NIBR02145]